MPLWYFLLTFTLLFSKGYEPFLSFTASKSQLIKIHALDKLLPLSGCHYKFDTKGCSVAGKVDFNSCDYTIQTTKLQATQIDWVHIMPASYFGKDMACMQEKVCRSSYSKKLFKGVRCCKQRSAMFKKMYADMHNILPVMGEYKKVHQQKLYGIKTGQIMPKQAFAKGIIARIYLYMAHTYELDVPKEDRKIWEQWHHDFAPSAWEKSRNQAIYLLQGNANTYIEPLTN